MKKGKLQYFFNKTKARIDQGEIFVLQDRRQEFSKGVSSI